MAYVTHNRTKSEAEALVGLKDTIYYTTDSNSIIINGKAYGAVAQKVTEEEFNNLLATNALTPGKTYRIIGFTTKVAPNDAVVSLEHKIDLYVTATSSNFVAAEAFAGYNSDGSDTYYEDNGVDVAQWQINVQVYGSKLGITKALTVQNTKITTLRVGDIKLIRHNGIDTLLVVYNKSKWIGRSTDGGQTFQHIELPLYSTDWKDIVYGNGKFILFDSDGTFLVSDDNGLTWTMYTDNMYMDVVGRLGLDITVNYGYRQGAYIEGFFYIVGQRVLLKSENGINWTAYQGVSHGWTQSNIAGGDGLLIMPGGF